MKQGKKRKKEMDREQRLLRTLLMKESQRPNTENFFFLLTISNNVIRVYKY